MTMKLDEKDKKILFGISQNARMPLTKIAKSVRLSRDAVSYRISNLEKAGVIQGYRAVVNAAAFGFDAYHVFLSMKNPEEKKEETLINFFKNHASTRAVIEFRGRYDFELAILSKNLKDLDKTINEMLNVSAENVRNYEVLALVDYYTSKMLPGNFYSESAIEKKVGKNKIQGIHETDEKDIKILEAISENPVSPLKNIARETGLTIDIVNYRIKKMVDGGVIARFVPSINYERLGYTMYAVAMNIQNLTSKKEAMLRQALSQDPNIIWAAKMLGRHNLLFYACVNNTEDFHNTIKSVRKYFAQDIMDYEILVAYKVHKFTYFPRIFLDR